MTNPVSLKAVWVFMLVGLFAIVYQVVKTPSTDIDSNLTRSGVDISPTSVSPPSQERKVQALSSPENPTVTISTTIGELQIELLPDAAPELISRFKELIESGYYSNNTVLESKPGVGFVIARVGEGARQFNISQDEGNNLVSQRGSVAVLKSGVSPAYLNNIFVGYHAQEQLQDNYVIFGQITHGLDAIEKNSVGKRAMVTSLVTQLTGDK